MGAWFVIAAGTIVVLMAGSSYRTVLRVRRWPTTRGRIVFRDVRHSRITENGHQRDEWTPIVSYEYVVDGVRFESTRIGYQTQPSHGYRERAEADLARIPDDVTVHYDPGKPFEATLEEGGVVGPWIGAAVGLGILAVGLTLLVSP